MAIEPDGLTAPADGQPTPALAENLERYVTFSVGGRRMALALAEVTQVTEPPDLARVPRAPGWLAGLTNLRGEVLAVVDLPALLGLAPLSRSTASRLLLTTDGSRTAGCLIERLHGLRAVAASRLESSDTPLCQARFDHGGVRHDLLGAALVFDAVQRQLAMRRRED
ncbi:MAG TPA: chemotaxis protein CheW [Thermoanaerobaculia bacterium]|nr:chemotaxis protein CheW [Thermoanaerobaculia bacterium]